MRYRLGGRRGDEVHLPLKMNMLSRPVWLSDRHVPVLHLPRVSACYFAAGDCIYIARPNGRRLEGIQADPASNRLVLSAARSIECESPNVTLAHNGKRFPIARERTDYDLNFQVTRTKKIVQQKTDLSFRRVGDSCLQVTRTNGAAKEGRRGTPRRLFLFQ